MPARLRGWCWVRPPWWTWSTCCGGCRQKIREFAGPDTPIHACGPAGLRVTFTLAELLPQSFGPESLGVDAPVS